MRTLRMEILDEGQTLRLVDTEGAVLGRRSLRAGEVDALVEELCSVCEGRALAAVGRRVYEWLDGSGGHWLEADGSAARGFALRLPAGQRQRDLPWELTVAPDGHYLVDDATCPFAPLGESSDAGIGVQRPAADRPLRALFIAASPEGISPPTAFEDEEAQIVSAAGSAGVELELEERGNLDRLREQLRDYGAGYFDVLHLNTPGDVFARAGPHLVLEDDFGRVRPVGAADLAEVIEGQWPAVLLLSGCHIGISPRAGFLSSLAESLVVAGAPCVIDWRYPPEDRRAAAMAAELYARLATGEPVDEAIARVRRGLLQGNSPHWHRLRVYVDRSSLGPLVTDPAITVADPSAAAANHQWAPDVSNGDGARSAAILHNADSLAVDRGEADEPLDLLGPAVDSEERIGAFPEQAATLQAMGTLAVARGEMEEGLELLGRALDIEERIGASRERAATLQAMGTLVAARGETEEGLELLGRALDIEERIGASREQAVTLHAMGALAATRGDIEEAMGLLGRALEIEERIGAADGQAATLHEMGGLAANRGEVGVALELLQRALDIDEVSGNARGRATTLGSIAVLLQEKGELEAAGAAAQEAVRLLVSLRAWPDLVAALVNLAVLQPDRAVSLLAQACWLTARVGIGPEYALRPALALVEALGPSHPSSLESSAYALALASAATRDPEKDSRLASSWTATARCLRARRVDPDRWHEFLRSDGLVDVDDVRQRLLASLPALVPPHAWVFERSELQRRPVRDRRQS